MDVIEFDVDTVSDVPFDKARYFSYAFGGAMGEGGGVLMVTSDEEVYHTNYAYGDNITYDDLVKSFPTLGECRFSLFGSGSTVPLGWNYVNLGMGNHLIVHDDVYADFEKEIAGLSPSKIYQKWLGIASPKCDRSTIKYPSRRTSSEKILF